MLEKIVSPLVFEQKKNSVKLVLGVVNTTTSRAHLAPHDMAEMNS